MGSEAEQERENWSRINTRHANAGKVLLPQYDITTL